jgi:hypothetical protein
MAESVNDVATVQQNLLKNLDDANAAILAQSRLNRSLQQELMGVRMLPFASQTERLYRIVRQTAKEMGKRANLDIVGGRSISTVRCSTRCWRRSNTCCAMPWLTVSRIATTALRWQAGGRRNHRQAGAGRQ